MKKPFFANTLKATGSLIGLVALLAIVFATNIILSKVNLRADLTEERLYSFSDGTKELLSKLDREITMKFFFSSSISEAPVQYKNFGRQIEDLLMEYRLAAKGKIKIEVYDPTPDSDAEEWAQKYGLAGQPLGMIGPTLYCGLVGISGDIEVVMPALSPGREGQIEYDITRMIAQVGVAKAPVLGVLSTLPVFGSLQQSPQMPPQQSMNPWFSFADLRKDYDVRTLEPDTDLIPSEIDSLIIVHPKDLPENTLYAIDQFLLRGGKILAFMDPFCLVDALTAQQQPYGTPNASSNMEQLLSAWGVTFDSVQVIADMDASTSVYGKDNKVEQNPVWLSLRKENIDSDDIVTSEIGSLLMAMTGTFSVEPDNRLTVTPLVRTSENSAPINLMSVQFGADAIKRDFKSSYKEHTLALRLHGNFKSAFPDKAPDNEENSATVHLSESLNPGAVILVGDVDMLFDQFCVQESNFMGFRAFQPLNDNITFFANAVEQISGSETLIGIRSRGTTQRPFTRVLKLQKQAQLKWLEEERQLENKLNDLRVRLNSLQQTEKDHSQRFKLSPEQEQENKTIPRRRN
ncbi:MAG: GldG family protein [Lentisphaerae bacterium]|nr:GldG family protein [Lentisphaerota bacterium]